MIITNGKIITWTEPNQILEGFDLLIRAGKISSIQKSGQLQTAFPQEEILDAEGKWVMPGNICAHTHFYGAYSRGMAIPGPAPRDFSEILASLWWKLDKALDEEGVYYSALTLLIDAIKYGTTTLFDHHASPNVIDGSLDIIYKALHESGLRASLCYEVTDRDGKEKAKAGMRENSRFIRRAAGGKLDALVRAHFGLHASLTVSDETLEAAVNENNGQAGFHAHAAEGLIDETDALQKYGKRVIKRFADRGILGPRTILAHGVHLDETEMDLLKASGTWLSHQPRSNQNNAVGVTPVPEMLARGVKVCLGNDGFSNAMWDEWFSSYLIQKDHAHNPGVMTGDQIVKMAITHNSELATTTFDGLQIGKIVPDAAADLIFVDYQPITPLSAGNLPWHILFGFRSGMVTMTMVAGKILMQNRKLLFLDEAAIAAKSREVAARTWAKIN